MHLTNLSIKLQSGKKQTSFLIMLFFIAVCLCGCSDKRVAEIHGITGTDDAGRIITLGKPAQRIALLTGSPTDVLFAIGAGEKIIAITDSYELSYPETVRKFPSLASLPAIGTRTAPNIESLIALRPDLVLVSGSSDNPEKNATALKNVGLTFAIMLGFDNIDAGLAQINRLGILCGCRIQGQTIASDLLKKINFRKSFVKTSTSGKPLVYYWWGSGNGTYGSKTALSELISISGGESISDSAGRSFFDLSPEYVVKSNPDIIIYSYWQERDKRTRIDALKKRPGFNNLKAIQTGKIHGINGHLIHSVMMFPEAIDSLTKWIHPELFK